MARYRRYKKQRSAGHERALQHIEAARRFSAEIGGLDNDVKSYFFSLPRDELDAILQEYEAEHGAKAREWAEMTIPKWRLGSVKMSGQTAERLFRLLPRRMPHAKKLALVEDLWKIHGPQSETTITFGPSHAANEVRQALSRHLGQVVQNYTLPDQLRARFDWLTDGDAVKCEEILNYFLRRDKEIAEQAIEGLVSVIAQTSASAPTQESPSIVQHVHRELAIGRHKVHMVLDPSTIEIGIRPGRHLPVRRASQTTASAGNGVGCVVVALVVALVLLFLLNRK